MARIQESPSPPTDTYRRDIDGIRAIAVMAVVAFHAGLPGFSGGFAGVDVFFVISGYLITGIILRGLERDRFSLADFYVRRINRIFPALLVVLCFTMLLGWLFMYGPEFSQLGKHVIGGSTFSANLVFWKESGYFDSPNKPLLHLWSLAVEEQFYLIWPVTALLVWRFKRDLRWTLIAIIEISFLTNLWQTRHYGGVGAFYLPLSRFWEILAGALLVHTEAATDPVARAWAAAAKRRRDILSLLGLTLVALSIVVANPVRPWPGWEALIPVAGTLMIIAAGRDAWASTRILSRRWLVLIGLVSYPLYLWHWPLLVFAKLIWEGEPPPWARLVVVAVSLLLAIGTYRLIERPVRFGAHKRRSALRLLPAMGAAAILGALAYGAVVEPRLELSRKIAFRDAGADWSVPQDALVSDGNGYLIYHTGGREDQTVVMYGDSHARQYWPRMVRLAADSGKRAVLIGYGGCPPLPETNHRGLDWEHKPWQCDRFNRAALEYMMKPAVKTVVIAAYWEGYVKDGITFPADDASPIPLRAGDPRLDKAFDLLEREIALLVQSGKRVFIVLSNPTLPKHGNTHGVPRRLSGFDRESSDQTINRQEFVNSTAWTTDRLRLLAMKTGAVVIDPVEFLCGPSTCPTVSSDGIPLYADDDHFRSGFVEKYAKFLDTAFKP